jgi:ATP-binding cassette subfamily B (MDR/TAP) protein 1
MGTSASEFGFGTPASGFVPYAGSMSFREFLEPYRREPDIGNNFDGGMLGGRDPYSVVSCFFLTISIMGILRLFEIIPLVVGGRVAMEKFRKVLSLQPNIDIFSSSGKMMTDCEGSVRFRDVTFAYPKAPEHQIMEGFTLTIDAGRTCALVGPSGSGKSTAIALMERFYDPTSGTVMLDGCDLKDLNLMWLRSRLGLVSQEPVLFSGTVFENIALGMNGATKDDVEAAAQRANAHDFIGELANGYDTLISTTTASVSGGQKQRIAIARALIRKPTILLLDEATSALDNESQEIVQRSLDALLSESNLTTIIIAHRLTTIRHADKIAVVSKGKVVEEGTHSELIELDMVYARLHEAGT